MRFLLLSLLLYCPVVRGQSYAIGTPEEWMSDHSPLKVMLISAEWCSYCRETRELFEKSQVLHTLDSTEVRFFEFPEKWPGNFSFQGKSFSYFASGPDQGRHEFVDYLLAQATTQSFPLFLIWDSRNDSYALHSGMLSESDWASVLTSILNQRASPDSVSNN